MADNTIANAIKFLKGEEKSLPAAKTEGQVYFAYKNVGTAEKPSYTGAIYIDTPIGGTQNRIKMTANADIADKAFNDSAGLNIRDTYLSSLGYTDDGKQTILIKGSGNNQTRIALPIASTTKSGIVTTDAQSFNGTKTFTTINSTNLTVIGSSGFSYTGIETATGDKARPVWFAYDGINGKPVVNTNFTYNPATQTLKVANLSGTADKATKDSAGNDIRNTYISDVTISGRTITVTKGSGAKVTLTTQDTDTWRGIQNNLTSDSTTDSLSAAQGKYLKSLIDGKSNNGHNHDDRYYTAVQINSKLANYLSLTGGTLTGTLHIKSSKVRRYDGNIRIHPSSENWSSIIMCGNDNTGDSGTSEKTWGIFTYDGQFAICKNGNGFSSIGTAYLRCDANNVWSINGNTIIHSGNYKTYCTPSNIGAAASSHTHNYASSASSGGAATSANKLNTNAGSATRPVYFSNGIPVQCDGTLANSISGNAATASKLQTARTITLAGSVTGSAAFDGSNNITITTSTNHSHSQYLPLAGGTMSGTSFITWADSGNWSNNNSNVTFPVSRGGLQWYGQSDSVKLFSQETASDNLELVLQFGDDDSNGLSIRNAVGTQTARIAANGNITASSFIGNLSGNASTATNADKLDGFHGSSSQAVNTYVLRDGSGYIYTNYINSNTPNSENPSISQIIVTNGSDNFYRKASLSHLKISLGSMPASDVYAWAKASTKPVYTWGEITGKPSTFEPSDHTHSSLKAKIETIPTTFNTNKTLTYNFSNNNSDKYVYITMMSQSTYATQIRAWGPDIAVRMLSDKASNWDQIVTSSSLSSSSVKYATTAEKANSANLLNKNNSFLDSNVGSFSYYDADISNTTNNSSWSSPSSGWHQIYHNDLSVANYWTELAFPINDINGLAWRQRRNSEYFGWYRILDSNNYTSYTVTKDGSGASGTWGINVTGSAGSVAWGNVSGKPSTFTPASHTHPYLPLSGGTMTGTINFRSDKLACNFILESSGYHTGIMHQTYGSEALVFATTSAFTSFIFKCGQDPTSMKSNTWANITPSMQIKQQSVYINSLINNTVTPDYNLYVNGTTRCNGTLGVGNGSSAEIDFFPKDYSTIKAKIVAYDDRIEFVFA